MNKQLIINVTNARKNFFNLIDQVAHNDIQVLITKEGLDFPIVLTKSKKSSTLRVDQKTQMSIVTKTAGSIKTIGMDIFIDSA